MQAPDAPILRDIVLIGGGHSHVGVLKHFAMQPMAGVRVTVICTDTHTPYSGMLPGYISGHYSYDECHIDLSRLAESAHARLLRDRVIGIDRAQRKVLCAGRPPVPYDLLSINIGSTPQVAQVPGALENVVPVKPIVQFNQRWLALLERVRSHAGRTTIAVVGGGAGGVEMVLSMQYRLRRELQQQGRNPDELVFHLFNSGGQILPTHNARVRAIFRKTLVDRGVIIHDNAAVSEVKPHLLITAQGEQVAADEIVWVTRAGGAAWLRDTGLELDEDGFLRVDDQLQTLNDERIFAAGDCASMVNHRFEKAGVFAVRQGMPLAENLRRSLKGLALKPYVPQKNWLALISTGDQHAVASRGWIGFQGDWVWRWKDWIDRRFMRKFGEFPLATAPMAQAVPSEADLIRLEPEEKQQAISAIAMRCGGCGAKVGATVLSRALASIAPIEHEDVLIGLRSPDDAAVVRVPPGKAVVQSVDFFRAFIDDPYIFGKVAANHALGDLWAMGAQAHTATAIATVPSGLESKTEDLVFQMMSGAVEVLNEAGCALVGGHTGEGKELALGFAVNGLIDADLRSAMIKGSMRPGDLLLLTKPIGTGTLFAAHARLQARGRWIDAALQSMVQSNRKAAQCLREHGVTAATDLTGFGLLGHLVEMTKPSGVDAQLNLSDLPLLDGAQEMVQLGIVSSLQPANVRLRRALRNQEAMVNHPRYPLLFDPQTAGGLLASIAPERAPACLAALHALGYERACIIGRVLPQGEALEPILLAD